MQGLISRNRTTYQPPMPPPMPQFPFTLSLTVNNSQDLASLWARFNMSGRVLRDASEIAARRGKKGPLSPAFLTSIESDPAGKKEVWQLLNDELKKSGIRRR